MATENEKYHHMAIAWGEKYLATKEISESFSHKKGETILDDRHFVSIQVERIKHSKGVELHQAYNRLRVFKHFYETLIKNEDTSG
jgi:hypothetical protein